MDGAEMRAGTFAEAGRTTRLGSNCAFGAAYCPTESPQRTPIKKMVVQNAAHTTNHRHPGDSDHRLGLASTLFLPNGACPHFPVFAL